MTTHPLGKLTTLFVSHIARRSTDEPTGVERLGIFTHIDTDKGIGGAKHKFCQLLGKISFSYAGRSEEHKGTDGVVGVFQSYAVALNGTHHLLNGFILSDDSALQFRTHTFEPNAFLLCHTLYGDASHHGYDVGHLLVGNHLTLAVTTALPLLVQFFQLFLKQQLLVTKVGSQLIILVLNSQLLLLFDLSYLLFFLSNLRRDAGIAEVDTGTHLVHSVDGLVGHETVVDIAFCQFDTGCNGFIRITDMVVIFVAVLDVVQDLQRLFVGGGFYQYLLKTSFEGSVFLDAIAIFIECSGTDTLDCPTCQCGFHDVGRIHGTRCGTCSDDGMDFVNKDDDVFVLF